VPAATITSALDDGMAGYDVEDNWTQVASAACDRVDAILATRYTVPFSAPLPALVREAARCFAAHILYLRRQAGDGSNPYTAEATRMETRLQRVADGLADLESAAGDADAVAIVEPSLTYSSGRLLL